MRREVLTIEPQISSTRMYLGKSPVHSIRLNEPAVFIPSGAVGLRLYSDNRPRNLEIAPLQKGLVMLFQGTELIEEGAGFGVPIAKYDDNTFFSITAQIYLENQCDGAVVLRKVFFLDAVSKKQLHGASVNDTFYSALHAIFERAYLRRQTFRPVFDWTMRLRKTLGIATQFEKVNPRGKVMVTYSCLPGIVRVSVDLSALDKAGAKEILVLNEQGASAFRKYSDSDGTVLFDGQIGAWARVTAKKAVFSDTYRRLSFSLENKSNALFIRGREQIQDRFSWAGLTYALSPKVSNFEYTISFEKNY